MKLRRDDVFVIDVLRTPFGSFGGRLGAKKAAAELLPVARLAKQAVVNGLEMDLDRANRYEIELFGLCFSNPEQREGMQTFLEK